MVLICSPQQLLTLHQSICNARKPLKLLLQVCCFHSDVYMIQEFNNYLRHLRLLLTDQLHLSILIEMINSCINVFLALQ